MADDDQVLHDDPALAEDKQEEVIPEVGADLVDDRRGDVLDDIEAAADEDTGDVDANQLSDVMPDEEKDGND